MNPCTSPLRSRRLANALRLATLVAAALAGVGSANGQQGSLELIGGLGGKVGPFLMEAHDLSGDGRTIVGADLTDDEDKIFHWTLGGGFQEIAPFNGLTQIRVSRDGSTVAAAIEGETRRDVVPFRWTLAGGLVTLDDPDADPDTGLFVGGCSSNGRVVIGAQGSMFGDEENLIVRWIDAAVDTVPIPGVTAVTDCSNSGAIVVGMRYDDSIDRTVCFRWSEADGLRDFGGVDVGFGSSDIPYPRCSADGSVVVSSLETEDGWDRAFVWTADDGVQMLRAPAGVPEFYDSYAYDCSADGSVVVGTIRWSLKAPPGDDLDAEAETLRPGSYVWIDGTPISLYSLIADRGHDVSDWYLNDAVACSSDGTIIIGHGQVYEPTYDNGIFRADIVKAVRKLPNRAPIANAGKDIVVRTTAKKKRVRLDGRASRDPDGDGLKFAWSAKGISFASGKTARPIAAFPVGKTTVKLTVTDGRGLKRSDTMTVTVIRTKRAGAADPMAEDEFVPSL